MNAASAEQADEPRLKAPYPAFGGKSRVAGEVWARFGDVRNYVEPFCFSAAVLLNRPGGAGPIETINDLNSFVANFWRAVKHDPSGVARHADHPVIEDDLHARHRWLVTSQDAQHKLARVREDPDYFDSRIAGWWCWGACCWIGSGWCELSEQLPQMAARGVNGLSEQLPQMAACGVNGLSEQLPQMAARGVNGLSEQLPQHSGGNGQGVVSAGDNLSEKMPLIGDRTKFGRGVQAFNPDAPNDRQPALGQAGWGVNALGNKRQSIGDRMSGSGVVGLIDDTHRPQLADAFARGRGVNANDAESTCDRRRAWLTDWMLRLADRLRPVRVCCGHWARVCDSYSTLTRLGMTGVFLDPPYRKELACGKKNRSAHIYANDKSQDVNALCDEVSEWCLKWGDSKDIRIALCGYEGEYPAIEAAGWTTHAWKSGGGYGNRTTEGKENAARERIWFSPSCLAPDRQRHEQMAFA